MKSDVSGAELQVYSIRWAILVMFIFSGAANALVLLSFAPITDLANTYWNDIGTTAINLFAVSFQIMYLPGTILALYISSKYNLRMIMLCGGLLTTVGCGLRFAGIAFVASGLNLSGSYVLVLLGTMLVALAQPFYINMPAKIAASWFAVKERDISTTLCSLANPLGSAIGSFIPALLVTSENDDGSGPIHGMQNLVLVHLLVSAAALFITFVAFRSAPPKPPSYSAMQMENNKAAADRKGMGHAIKELLCNKNYLCLLFSFTVVLSNLNALAALLNQLPGGHSNTQAGLCGTVLILSGFFGALITGVVLDFTKSYRTIITVAYVTAMLSWGMFMASCGDDQVTFFIISASILGFTLLPTSKYAVLVGVLLGYWLGLGLGLDILPVYTCRYKLHIIRLIGICL